MKWNDITVRPQGARAKARSSPPARFTSHSSEGSHINKNQNKKPLTQISLQNLFSNQRCSETPWALPVPSFRFYNAAFALHRHCPGAHR